MRLEAASQGSCSSAGGLQGSLPFHRGHPHQTGPWKSGVRELDGYFPTMRADDRKGNSQWMISCLAAGVYRCLRHFLLVPKQHRGHGPAAAQSCPPRWEPAPSKG